MKPLEYKQMMSYLTRPAMADGGRIGFRKGERADLELENLTRAENAKRLGVKTRDAPFFKALPGYDNITYTDFRNKETGEVFRKYNVRVRVRDKNKTKTATTADKYKNIDSLDEALKLRDDFRKENPKNIKPLDKEKQKITKDTRRADIRARGGVEDFLVAEEGSGIQKGHAQNIKNPNVKIKPSNIIYTPTAINEAMAGKGDAKALDLDFKIREAENKIKKIKNSRASAGAKKKLLAEQDNLLMKYVAQSDGFKTATLSDGNVYGEVFQKSKSMDMLDFFPNMTEKEAKTFVRQYITEKGDLKPFYKRKVDAAKVEAKKRGVPLNDVLNEFINAKDVENIQKSKLFLDNVELAKQNAKKFDVGKLEKSIFSKYAAIGCPGKAKGGRVEFNLGGSTQCIARGLEKVRSGTNLSPGDQANIRAINNITKTAKGAKAVGTAARVLGAGVIAPEIVFGGFFAATDYATGANKDEIISNLTFGLGGKSMKEQLKKSDPRYGQADKLTDVYQGYLSSLDKMGQPKQYVGRPGKRTTERDVLKAMEPFTRVNPQTETGDFFDLGMYESQLQKDRGSEAKFAEDKMQRALERGFYDPGVGGSRRISEFQAAGGGIAKEAGDPSGAMLESMNPDSQGLSGLLKRVKKG